MDRLWAFVTLCCCIGIAWCQRYTSICPSQYKSYEGTSCFKFPETAPATFSDSNSMCMGSSPSGTLLTVSNERQLKLLTTYMKFYANSGKYWIGICYNDSTTPPTPVDINGNAISSSVRQLLDLNDQSATGCVSVEYVSDTGLMFVAQSCSELLQYVCMTELIVPEITLASNPMDFVVPGETVELTCSFTISSWSADLTIYWNTPEETIQTSRTADSTETGQLMISRTETQTITNFQSTDVGLYSCAVTTKYTGASSAALYIDLATPPVISRQPEDAIFYEGQLAFFECALNGSSSCMTTNVTWFKDGVEIDTASLTDKYFVSPDTKTLLITEVEFDDEGEYHCMLSNAAGSVTSRTGNLTVLSAGDASSVVDGIRLAPQSRMVCAGRSVTFDCVGSVGDQPSAEYQWNVFHEGQPMDSKMLWVPTNQSLFSSQSYLFEHGDQELTIECVFNNGTAVRDATLTVRERPSITNITMDTTVTYGTDFTVSCDFAGSAPLDVDWLFNGGPTAIDASTVSGQRIELTIKNFQPANMGLYQCVVTGARFSAIAGTFLTGQDGKPSFALTSIMAETRTIVEIGWFVLLYTNTDPDLLQYRLTWTDSAGHVNTTMLSPQTHQFLLTQLQAGKQLEVSVVAIDYMGDEGTSAPAVTGSPFGNAPGRSPTGVTVKHYGKSKQSIVVSWDPVVPDHSLGEGDIFAYELEYHNDRTDTGKVLERVPKTPTEVKISGLDPHGGYFVRVRSVVMVQSIPMTTKFEQSPWSEWVELKGDSSTAPVKSTKSSTSTVVPVAVTVVAVVLIALALGILLIVWKKWTSKRRQDSIDVAYSSMKNDDDDDDEHAISGVNASFEYGNGADT